MDPKRRRIDRSDPRGQQSGSEKAKGWQEPPQIIVIPDGYLPPLPRSGAPYDFIPDLDAIPWPDQNTSSGPPRASEQASKPQKSLDPEQKASKPVSGPESALSALAAYASDSDSD
eukprot:Clim_evm51s253 gene=Clim_evmTU51s253